METVLRPCCGCTFSFISLTILPPIVFIERAVRSGMYGIVNNDIIQFIAYYGSFNIAFYVAGPAFVYRC